MDLKVGSAGPLVYTIQEQLNLRMPASDTRPALKLTGRFDADTEKRVKQFQEQKNLVKTGVVDDITSAMITKSTFEYEAVPRPIVIAQDRSTYHCWAASLSSWTQAVPRVVSVSMWEALDQIPKIPGATAGSKGGLTVGKGWGAVVKRWHLNFKAYGGTNGAPAGDFSIDNVLRLLKKRGPLLVAYNLPSGTVAHTVVVYGVLVDFSADEQAMTPYRVWVMDPWENARIKPYLSTLTQSGNGALLLMWK